MKREFWQEIWLNKVRNYNIKLEQNDIVAFITDGVCEAHATEDEQFGFERTVDIIKLHQKASAMQIIQNMYKTVTSFSKHEHQEDDITSIICKVNSNT
ncbi:SpoIIE family protein phosphatase [candidate division KSB1 bacterium]|nr:SpoIIE family protein phosphatase [candidate division KSB1 bacterium]